MKHTTAPKKNPAVTKQKVLAWACHRTDIQLNERINGLIDKCVAGDEEAQAEAQEIVAILKRREKTRES